MVVLCGGYVADDDRAPPFFDFEVFFFPVLLLISDFVDNVTGVAVSVVQNAAPLVDITEDGLARRISLLCSRLQWPMSFKTHVRVVKQVR